MKGDTCGFLHKFDTQRMPVCRNLLKFGTCKEPDCPYKHTTEEIKECNMYKLGFCIYGPAVRTHASSQRGGRRLRHRLAPGPGIGIDRQLASAPPPPRCAVSVQAHAAARPSARPGDPGGRQAEGL